MGSGLLQYSWGHESGALLRYRRGAEAAGVWFPADRARNRPDLNRGTWRLGRYKIIEVHLYFLTPMTPSGGTEAATGEGAKPCDEAGG